MSVDAQSIYVSATDKSKLAELRAGLIDSVAKESLSQKYKSKRFSGDPTSGSVIFSRFSNAISKNYGSARTAGKGEFVKDNKVTVVLDQYKEIIEEINKTDLKLYGVSGIVEQRISSHRRSMEVELDRAFFAEASKAGTAITLKSTNIKEQLEEAIVSIESIEDATTDGVDRSEIVLCLNLDTFSKARNALDDVKTVSTDNGVAEIGFFHGVRVESNLRQSDAIIAMRIESIGQPVTVTEYNLNKIPLSDDYSLELFYRYGTKALTANLIKKVTTLPTAGKA